MLEAVQGRDHRLLAHAALERDLAPGVGRDRPVGAAEQDVGLDADRAQLAHRVLGGLGLQLAGRGDVRHQRDVDIGAGVARQLVAELADGLEEGQALDVADRAADLDQHDVGLVHVPADELLDGVGDVRDHLDGAAQIVALALAAEHGPVDPAGRDAVRGARRHVGEALVVAEVEVGLGPVVGHEHLAVLVGRHRAGIDVEVGVQLAEADPVAAELEQRAEGGGGEALAERAHDAAGDENVALHQFPVSVAAPARARGGSGGARAIPSHR